MYNFQCECVCTRMSWRSQVCRWIWSRRREPDSSVPKLVSFPPKEPCSLPFLLPLLFLSGRGQHAVPTLTSRTEGVYRWGNFPKYHSPLPSPPLNCDLLMGSLCLNRALFSSCLCSICSSFLITHGSHCWICNRLAAQVQDCDFTERWSSSSGEDRIQNTGLRHSSRGNRV